MAYIEHDYEWERDFLTALGGLVVQSGYLEAALADLVWAVGLNERLSPLTEDEFIRKVGGKTLGNLFEMVTDAFPKRVDDQRLLDKMAVAKPVIARAIRLRNDFVHAFWAFGSQTKTMSRHRRPKIKGGPSIEIEHKITISEVEAATEEIGAAQDAALDLCDTTAELVPIRTRGGCVLPDGTYVPGGSVRTPDPGLGH